MKLTLAALLSLTLSLMAYASADDTKPGLLTKSEAETIVASREAAKDAREDALRQELDKAEVVNSKVVRSGDRTLKINSVKPVVLEKPITREPPAAAELSAAQFEAMRQAYALITHEQISLGANVYGDEYSEITWRDARTGASFTVWTNVSLNYLRPVTSIQDEGYDYMYFGFVTTYTEEAELTRLQLAREMGFEAESRWKEPPVRFSPDKYKYEYVVIANKSDKVPEKLYRQLDAVLGHYLANKEALEISHHNAVTLEAARKKYLEENPPAPKQTMVNFWKIDSGSASE
jgi:hypothetical protein